MVEKGLDRVMGVVGYARRDTVTKELESMLRSNRIYPISHYEPQDVFVAGYPKSGNTWMQHIITGLVAGIDTRFLPDSLASEFVPDIHYKKYYKRFRNVCIFKTHHVPKPHYNRVIHLVRDGRDAMASYYAYNQSWGNDVSMKDMIIEGKGIFPCQWHEHARQWLDNPYDAEILRVRYEKLLHAPMEEMKRICAFLEIEREVDLLRRVAVGCSFKHMQKREEKYGRDRNGWPTDEHFVRRGERGSYKDEIPSDLVAAFEETSREEMEALGYL